MTFIEQWQRQLPDSLAEFARLVAHAQDIDFTHGILATAMLWPIRAALQEFDGDAIDAVRQIAGAPAKHVLRAVQSWGEDPLEAARGLAAQAAGNAELGQALSAVIQHFDAATCFALQLSRLYASQLGGDTFNIAEQIKAALVNVGGVTNIQSLNLQLTPAAPLQPQLQIPAPPEPTHPPEIGEFVGRQAELTTFAQRLADEHLAVISGMAGVGKTALAVALAEVWQVWQMSPPLDTGRDGKDVIAETVLGRQAEAEGQVLWHSFHEGEGVMTLIWKLAGFLAWRGQDDLWRMLQGAQQSGGQPPPPDCLFDYALQMLSARGYLLCLDDMQWVEDDPLLVQFIQRLEALIRAGEVWLILTSRHVPDVLRWASFEPLGGLSAADTGRLAASHGLYLSEDLVEELYTHTEGNAELLILAINVLKRADHPERVMSRLAETDDIERYLIQEVDEVLTDEDRAVLIAVAVLLGYPGSRDAIETVSGRRRLKRLLLELTDRHLLSVEECEVEELYSEHAILRAFYYDLPGRDELRAMHRLAGEYYEREERDLLKAALHYERAGECQKAAELATADVWALINQGQARPLSRLLARFTAGQVDPEEWVKVKLALGQVQAFLGEKETAQEQYQEALSALATLPDAPEIRDLKASICRWLAELHLQHGEYDPALKRIEEGLVALEGREIAEIAELTLIAAHVHCRRGDYERALTRSRESLDLGQKFGRVTVLARAHNNLGLVHWRREENVTAIEHFQKSLNLYQQTGDLMGAAKSYNLIGSSYVRMGRWSEAERHFHWAYEIFDRLGNIYWCAGMDNNLGEIALNQGRLDEALSLYQSGLSLLEQTDGSLYLLGLFHNNLGATFIRLNEPDKARHHLRLSQAYCEKIRARDFLPGLHRLWAEAALLANELDEAEAQGEQSLSLARELGTRGEEGRTLRVLGEIATAQGQFDQAEHHLVASLSIMEQAGDIFEEARCQLSLAKLLGMQGKHEAGLDALERCMSTFERLDAALDLAAARALQEEMSEASRFETATIKAGVK
jgi:tetratricopeptide (TPR) repeat protein